MTELCIELLQKNSFHEIIKTLRKITLASTITFFKNDPNDINKFDCHKSNNNIIIIKFHCLNEDKTKSIKLDIYRSEFFKMYCRNEIQVVIDLEKMDSILNQIDDTFPIKFSIKENNLNLLLIDFIDKNNKTISKELKFLQMMDVEMPFEQSLFENSINISSSQLYKILNKLKIKTELIEISFSEDIIFFKHKNKDNDMEILETCNRLNHINIIQETDHKYLTSGYFNINDLLDIFEYKSNVNCIEIFFKKSFPLVFKISTFSDCTCLVYDIYLTFIPFEMYI